MQYVSNFQSVVPVLRAPGLKWVKINHFRACAEMQFEFQFVTYKGLGYCDNSVSALSVQRVSNVSMQVTECMTVYTVSGLCFPMPAMVMSVPCGPFYSLRLCHDKASAHFASEMV